MTKSWAGPGNEASLKLCFHKQIYIHWSSPLKHVFSNWDTLSSSTSIRICERIPNLSTQCNKQSDCPITICTSLGVLLQFCCIWHSIATTHVEIVNNWAQGEQRENLGTSVLNRFVCTAQSTHVGGIIAQKTGSRLYLCKQCGTLECNCVPRLIKDWYLIYKPKKVLYHHAEVAKDFCCCITDSVFCKVIGRGNFLSRE